MDSSSRWQFTFSQSENVGQQTIFSYTLTVKPDDGSCRPVWYRSGNCCNSTLDEVWLSLAPGFDTAVESVIVYNEDGAQLPIRFSANNTYGLKIILPDNLFVTSIPQNAFYTFDVYLNSTQWSDTTVFPCSSSMLEPRSVGCDIRTHGWQTVAGSPETIKVDPLGLPVANCCPEGHVTFCDEAIAAGTCNPRQADSPFRVAFNGTRYTGSDSTLVSFKFSRVRFPPNHLPTGADCTRMDLASIRLYVDDGVADKVQDVAFGGASVGFTVVKDVLGTSLAIATGLPTGSVGGRTLDLTLGGLVQAQSVCSLRVGKYQVCNYVLEGVFSASTSRYTCCTQGDVDVKTVSVPVLVMG